MNLWEWLTWLLTAKTFDGHTTEALNVANPDCVCGHPYAAHEHYRAGDDCGACGPNVCGSYRPGDQANVDKAFQNIVANWDTTP